MMSHIRSGARLLFLHGKTLVRAHAVVCVCFALGWLGGAIGCAVCTVAGIFFELIMRRFREERAASQAVCPPSADDERLFAARAVLELPADASLSDIKAAHRRLAAQYHPDGAQADAAQFMRVQEAYETLISHVFEKS